MINKLEKFIIGKIIVCINIIIIGWCVIEKFIV